MGQRTNKKQKQLESHKKHEEIRRHQPNLDRKEANLPQREKILLVCEGKNTEPSYFKQFKNIMLEIEVVGEGYNTVSLVKRAEELKKTKYQDYKVYCVFDADPKPDNLQQLVNFNNAIKKADALGFFVAYSNQAFEYWLLLHFEDHQGGAMDRELYATKINKYLKAINPKVAYDKDKKIITEEMFTILLAIDSKTGKSRQQLAVERAEKIYNNYDHLNPANEESSTTVYQLVNRLNNK